MRKENNIWPTLFLRSSWVSEAKMSLSFCTKNVKEIVLVKTKKKIRLYTKFSTILKFKQKGYKNKVY
jgi:hypothetical protein